MQQFFKMFLVCVMLTFSCAVCLANDGEFTSGDPDAEVPLDGGVVCLLAAGVGYGIQQAVKKRKAVTENKVAKA